MTKNWEKKLQLKKNLVFLDQKLQFTYPLASIKNVQVTEEAFNSQKRPSNTSKHELLNFFFTLLFGVIFALLDPDPIRIRNPEFTSKQIEDASTSLEPEKKETVRDTWCFVSCPWPTWGCPYEPAGNPASCNMKTVITTIKGEKQMKSQYKKEFTL